MLVWGAVAVTSGVFGSLYFSSKAAARQCLQCFVDLKDKESRMHRVAKELLLAHHPDAQKFMIKEALVGK